MTYGQRVPAWQDNWLVIADANADPFILDTQTGKILFAMHGTGSWDPYELAPDLPTLVAALAAIGTVFEDAGEDLRNEDWELKPQHRAAAIDRVTAILGTVQDAELLFEALEG